MTRLGVAATNRASFYLYNTTEDVDRLAASVLRVSSRRKRPGMTRSCPARA